MVYVKKMVKMARLPNDEKFTMMGFTQDDIKEIMELEFDKDNIFIEDIIVILSRRNSKGRTHDMLEFVEKTRAKINSIKRSIPYKMNKIKPTIEKIAKQINIKNASFKKKSLIN